MSAVPDRVEDRSDDIAAYARTRDRALRNRLIEANRGLAYHVAARYDGRGVPREDLRQIAVLGLLRAVERFDPTRGVAFSTYAGRAIEGTIKEHFRDSTWGLRVPRSFKELRGSVRRAEDELTQRLGRSPTVAELAREADVSEEMVLDALMAGQAYRPDSLDVGPGEGDRRRPEPASSNEAALDMVEDRALLRPLLESLDERERRIVTLHFFGHRSQSAIAEELGISQMHVSRLLRRALVDMRSRAERP